MSCNKLAVTRVFWTSLKNGGTGYKQRVAGSNRFATKVYDGTYNTIDLSQNTELNQPYLSGFIAPNENIGLKNANGSNRFIAHNEISYSPNSSFSITIAMNYYGVNYPFISNFGIITQFFGSRIGIGTTILFPPGAIYIRNSANTIFAFANSRPFIDFYSGKNIIFTIVIDINQATLFVNGAPIQTISVSGTFAFGRLFSGTATDTAFGSAHYYRIQDGAMTWQQVQEEHTMIRSLLPEIESVQIGAQTWATSNLEMVTTPMGRTIPEVQLSVNTERITNAADRDFSSNTGFWSLEVGHSITSGVLRITNAINGTKTFKIGLLQIGRWYKITYTLSNYVAGAIVLETGTSQSSQKTANGTYVDYIKCLGNTNLIIRNLGVTTVDLDNITLEEIGWAGLQEVYDHVFAATAGTTAQKETAAAREAAAWCYYNNSADTGAIYGKLYNWYAAKMLQDDIDEFNAANPSTPYGWRVPTQTDFNTLATHLGGTSVAGGALKLAGTTFWNSPNTSATNASGFSAIAGGFRNALAAFSSSLTGSFIWGVEAMFSRLIILRHNSQALELYPNDVKTQAMSIRLIKS